jgi:hypothetical protein
MDFFVVLGSGCSSIEMWEEYLIHSTEFRTAYHETTSGRFYRGGQTQNALVAGGKHTLAGRYCTSFCSFGRHVGGYVGCATTDSVLEQKMPDQFPHLQIIHKPYPSSPAHPLVHGHIIAEAMSRDWSSKEMA